MQTQTRASVAEIVPRLVNVALVQSSGQGLQNREWYV